jgi:hypothetical protein
MVSAAVTGSLAISIMIIASTGLLGLEQRGIDISDHPVSTTTAFSGVRSDLDNVGTFPLYVTRGLQALQLPYPSGTVSNYAVQSFESLEDINLGSQLTATVDGMSAGVDCEVADLDVQYWYCAASGSTGLGGTPPVPYSSAMIKSPSCQFEIAFPYYETGINYVTMVTPYNCNNKYANGPDRLLVLYGTTLTVSSNITGLGNVNVSMVQSTQLVCKPYYSFGKVSVTINNTQDTTQTITNILRLPESKLVIWCGVSAWDIAEAYQLVLLNAQLDLGPLNPWQGGVPGDLAFYFSTLQYPNKQSTDFLNPSLLKDAFESFYSLLSTQIVRNTLVKASDENTTGTLSTREERLVVHALSLRLLEGLLGFVAALGICMIFLLPTTSVAPRDPGSILGTAFLLSRSQHALRTLKDTGSLTSNAIKTRIFGIEYSTSLETLYKQPHFRVEADVPPYYKLDAMPNIEIIQKWWHPFMAGRWALGLCVLVQVSIIVALEVTWRQSQHHNGLADVSTDNYLPYTWTFLPAFVLSCIAMAYTSIGFHFKVFAPYSALKTNTNFSKALLVNYLDKAEIHCMWSAARFRQFAVSSITSAVILGSFLTVAVSGVFVVQETPAQISVDVSIASWFNTSDVSGGVIINNQRAALDGPSSLNALVASALVVEGNLSYPAWTYGEYVFPHIQVNHQSLADLSNAQLKNVTSLQMRVPALRLKMECGWYRADKKLNATFDPVSTCTTHDNGSTTCINSIDYTSISWNANDNPYCSGNGYFTITPVGIGVFGYASNLFPNCPPTYSWGSTGDQKINHAATMTCNNTMEQLDGDVTFTLPEFLIDPSSPPVGDESTATFFTFPDILDGGALYGGLPNFTAPAKYIDNYFTALTQGKDDFPVTELANPDLDDTIVARIKHLTALIRAQEYNTQGRVPATGAIATRKLTGTATDPYRTRLVQTQVSTRIFQCLLGVMAVLVIFSHFTMDTRRLLQKNPCSIAGMASLLVDSELLRDEAILSVAGWKSNGELRKKGLLKWQVFGLGWFDLPSVRHSVEGSGMGPVSPISSGSNVRYSIPRRPLPSVRKRFGVDLIKGTGRQEEAVGLTATGTVDDGRT